VKECLGGVYRNTGVKGKGGLLSKILSLTVSPHPTSSIETPILHD